MELGLDSLFFKGANLSYLLMLCDLKTYKFYEKFSDICGLLLTIILTVPSHKKRVIVA